MASWDFDNIWCEAADGKFPALQWEGRCKPQNIIVRYNDQTATIPEDYIERFDDGNIEISVPKNIFKRFYRWIKSLV